jgi:hypothetical protein
MSLFFYAIIKTKMEAQNEIKIKGSPRKQAKGLFNVLSGSRKTA